MRRCDNFLQPATYLCASIAFVFTRAQFDVYSGGYRWILTSVDSDALDMKEHSYEPARAGVGGAGASVWRFTPKHAGRTRLELKKVRPWNPGDPAGERFAVDLEVGGA